VVLNSELATREVHKWYLLPPSSAFTQSLLRESALPAHLQQQVTSQRAYAWLYMWSCKKLDQQELVQLNAEEARKAAAEAAAAAAPLGRAPSKPPPPPPPPRVAAPAAAVEAVGNSDMDVDYGDGGDGGSSAAGPGHTFSALPGGLAAAGAGSHQQRQQQRQRSFGHSINRAAEANGHDGQQQQQQQQQQKAGQQRASVMDLAFSKPDMTSRLSSGVPSRVPIHAGARTQQQQGPAAAAAAAGGAGNSPDNPAHALAGSSPLSKVQGMLERSASGAQPAFARDVRRPPSMPPPGGGADRARAGPPPGQQQRNNVAVLSSDDVRALQGGEGREGGEDGFARCARVRECACALVPACACGCVRPAARARGAAAHECSDSCKTGPAWAGEARLASRHLTASLLMPGCKPAPRCCRAAAALLPRCCWLPLRCLPCSGPIPIGPIPQPTPTPTPTPTPIGPHSGVQQRRPSCGG
jgi:hypothetical protein